MNVTPHTPEDHPAEIGMIRKPWADNALIAIADLVRIGTLEVGYGDEQR